MAAGDQEALGALYDATESRVFAVALRVLRLEADAEEAAADAFHQAWEQAGRFDPTRGGALSWLLSIAWSRAVDRLRARRRRPEQPLHPDGDHPAYTDDDALPAERLLDAVAAGSAVHAALSTLGDPPRTPLALAFLDGLSHAEVAERTGMPLGTVKSHIRRGLAALKPLLQARGFIDG